MKRVIIIGMLLLIAFSPLCRGLYFALEATIFLSAMALLAVVYFLIKIANKEILYMNKWILILGSLLILAYAISFTQATNARENTYAMLQFTEYLLLSLVLMDYYHDKKQQFGWTLMLLVSISGFINAVIGIEALSGAFGVLNDTLNGGGRRLGAAFQYANTAAIYFAIVLVFTITLINTTDKLIARVLFAGMGNTAFLAMLLTGSRGGYITAFAVFLLFVIIQPSKHRLKTAGSFICAMVPAFLFTTRISALIDSKDYALLTQWLLLSFIGAVILGLAYEVLKSLISKAKIKPVWGMVALLVAVAGIGVILLTRGLNGIIPQSIIDRFAKISLNEINIHLRLEFDEWGLRLLSENWVIGRGGGAWESLYQSVQDEFFQARFTHNHYLQVFIESGILGFAAFIGIIVVSLSFMVYAIIKTKDVRQKLLITGLLCGFAGLAVHSSFDFNLTFVSLSFLLWAFIAGSAISLPERSMKPEIDKITSKSGNNVMKYILVVTASLVFSMNGLYTAAAYNADKGYQSMKNRDFPSARVYYEEAIRFDSNNPVYYYQLAKIYDFYASRNTKEENIQGWREMALQASEKSVALDSFLPDYRGLLIQIYFKAEMPVEALDNAKRLIELQPLNNSNFEVLARAYFEAGQFYTKNGNSALGKELLQLCTQVNTLPQAKETPVIISYKERASDILNNK